MRRSYRFNFGRCKSSSDSEMQCISCREDYFPRNAGTCKQCYVEACHTEEELKREVEDLKAKVAFLRLSSFIDHGSSSSFTDVVFITSEDDPPIPAHKAVLVSRSPVFKAMLENEMQERRSGTIKISDVSYEALRTFIYYLYTGEACLDQQMACDLLVMSEKYQVKHLKTYCERFLVTELSPDNSLMTYAFAHQHNSKQVLDAALSQIIENMEHVTKREEYMELVEKDPRLIVEIYEAYLSKQVKTAAAGTSTSKTGSISLLSKRRPKQEVSHSIA